MTADGTAAARYRRAIRARSLLLAEMAAREMGHVPLGEALGLLGLYAVGDRRKYERAAVRWLARFALEANGASLRDLHLAGAALEALPTRPETAMRVLAALVAPAGAASVRRLDG